MSDSARRDPRARRQDIFYFVLLFALAAALRVAYTLASRKSPFFDHLDLDTKFYDSWARRIAAGDWVGHEVFFMGPLYPYFLAVVYKIFGPSILAAKLVQGLVGSLTAGFVYLLGREFYGVAAGLLAGILAAVYVPFIFTDSQLLFPVLATLLNTIMLFLLYRGLHRESEGDIFGSGVAGGLSAAGNASVLAFAPFAIAFTLLRPRPALRSRVRQALLFAAGLAVVIIPIAVRNYAVGRDFVPLTSNAGLNFYIGNSAKATGAYVKPEGLDIYTDPSGAAIAERARGGPLKPSQVSAFWQARAMAYIRQNPGTFLYNMARKIFFFWSVYEIPQIEHLQFERQYSWLLRIPTPSFGIICPLGIIGAIVALRRRKEAWLLLLFILAYSASIIAFFVVARYRLPAVPALMVFAAFFVLWLVRRGMERRWRHLALGLAGFFVLFAVVHINFYRIAPQNGFAQSYYRLGVIYESKGDAERALTSYEKSLELDPTIVPARVNAGILLSRRGDYEAAREQFADAYRRDPDYDKGAYNLGLAYAEAGMNDSALVMYDRALKLNPSYGLARLAKAAAYYESGSLASADTLLVALSADSTLPPTSQAQVTALAALIPGRLAWLAGRTAQSQRLSDSYLLRGDDLAALGLAPRALDAYLRAIEIDPASTAALFEAGTLFFNMGELDRSQDEFARILKISRSYKGAHFAIGVIAYRKGDIPLAVAEFEKELEVDPSSALSHINLAKCYEQDLKDFPRAAYHLRRYIELTGGTDELRNHLKELEAK